MNLTLSFEKKFSNLSTVENEYQFFRIHLTTMTIIEQDNLQDEEGIEKVLNFVNTKDSITVNDLIDHLKMKGWKLF